MTTPISGYQKRKQHRSVTYTALLRYLQRYCAYKGKPDAYKRLLASAGVNLRRKPGEPRYFRPIRQEHVRKVLELYFSRFGAREMRRRSKIASRMCSAPRDNGAVKVHYALETDL